MTTPPRYVPADFVDPTGARFGYDGVRWAPVTREELSHARASVVQHHTAKAYRRAVFEAGMSLNQFAVSHGIRRERLSLVLNGSAVMQLTDLGTAATMGRHALPDTGAVATDVARIQERVRRLRPPGGGAATGPAEWIPNAPSVINTAGVGDPFDLTPYEAARQTSMQAAAPTLLGDVLLGMRASTTALSEEEKRPVPGLNLRVRVATGWLAPQAYGLLSESAVHLTLCLRPTWMEDVVAGGWFIIDGHPVVDVLATDARDRPTSALVVLEEQDELGEPQLVSAVRTVAWTAAGPTLSA